MRFSDYLKSLLFILIILQIAPPLITNMKKQYSTYLEPHAQVGLISIKGLVTDSGTYIKHLQKFFKDEDIKAILLKIDCHGSATGSGEAIYNEIIALKKEYRKPIIALVENIAASGGYLISCAADQIVGSSMGMFGSIGVSLPYLFQLDQFINSHNISYVNMKAGKFKSATDPFVPITDDEKQNLQKVLDSSYDQFIKYVATSRKLPIADAPKWGNAKLFSGTQAHNLGLIDRIGGISQAVEIIKDKALIVKKINWVKPEEQRSLLQMIVGSDESENDGLYSCLWQSFFTYLTAQRNTMYAK